MYIDREDSGDVLWSFTQGWAQDTFIVEASGWREESEYLGFADTLVCDAVTPPTPGDVVVAEVGDDCETHPSGPVYRVLRHDPSRGHSPEEQYYLETGKAADPPKRQQDIPLKHVEWLAKVLCVARQARLEHRARRAVELPGPAVTGESDRNGGVDESGDDNPDAGLDEGADADKREPVEAR